MRSAPNLPAAVVKTQKFLFEQRMRQLKANTNLQRQQVRNAKAAGMLNMDVKKAMQERQSARHQFEIHDTNRSGTMDIDEFFAFTQTLGLALTHDQLEKGFLSLDKNADGDISFAEFENWYVTALHQSM